MKEDNHQTNCDDKDKEKNATFDDDNNEREINMFLKESDSGLKQI